MSQPIVTHIITKADSILSDSILKADSLARVDSLHVIDSLKAVVTLPRGFVGVTHPSLPQTEAWVFILLLLCFFLLVYSISQSIGFISDTVRNFFQVKERSSIFSKATVNDSRFRFFILIFAVSVMSFYAYLVLHKNNIDFLPKDYALILLISSLFLVLKSLLFDLIGYVFLNPVMFKMAKVSYFNTISFLGIALFPLLFLQIFIPEQYAPVIQSLSLILCIGACILVIIKLFQIFFSHHFAE